MRAPTATSLLAAWEHGLGQPPARRALSLLATASPDVPYEELVRISVGTGDARLLDLRELLFGPRLNAVSSCPRCGEKIEMLLSVSDLRAAHSGDAVPEPLAILAAGHDVTFRLPNLSDMEAAALAANADSSRAVLLARCVLAAVSAAGVVEPGELSAPVIAAVAEAMGRADPQAASEIAMTCPACTHSWTVAFDAGAYLWTEIHAWAQQLLRDVHALASAYGWSETEVLALSPARRRAYLDLVQS